MRGKTKRASLRCDIGCAIMAAREKQQQQMTHGGKPRRARCVGPTTTGGSCGSAAATMLLGEGRACDAQQFTHSMSVTFATFHFEMSA